MMGRRALAGLVAVGSLLAVGGLPAGASNQRPPAAADAQIDLVTQTPVVAQGGTFAVWVRLGGVPAEGSVRLVIHARVRSRSELAASMEGAELRGRVIDTVTPLSALAPDADGARRVAVSLDPATGGLALQTEGVYPVQLIAQDALGTPLATLVTHLILAPPSDDEAPALGVAVVVDLGAPPALQPDGTIELDRGAVDAMGQLVTGLLAAPTVPVTMAASPETLDALQASTEPADALLLDGLRSAAGGRYVLARPYVEVSPDELVASGLAGEVGEQLSQGRRALTDALGVEPVTTVGVAPPTLDTDGANALRYNGQRRLVVAEDRFEPLSPDTISYSLAQPFLLTGPAPVEVLSTDATVLERLATDDGPGLVVSRVLAELALLRLEQPSVARSVVVPIGPGVPATVERLLLEGLAFGRPFAAMSLDQAFDHAEPLLDGGGNQLHRALVPLAITPLPAQDRRAIADARAHLETFAELVGNDGAVLDPLSRHLLLASSSALGGSARRAHLAAVEGAVDAVSGAVSTPGSVTLTLTARDGTIPLTITNDARIPLHVSVRLSSRKLEFPDGDTIDLDLPEGITRIDINVRTRATGAFPLDATVVTPDGQRVLANTRYTVRSTAVSGVGLVISLGAGLFLVVWWARHWRRTRRSKKLVAVGGHPAALGG
jgi:hypothetical protein